MEEKEREGVKGEGGGERKKKKRSVREEKVKSTTKWATRVCLSTFFFGLSDGTAFIFYQMEKKGAKQTQRSSKPLIRCIPKKETTHDASPFFFPLFYSFDRGRSCEWKESLEAGHPCCTALLPAQHNRQHTDRQPNRQTDTKKREKKNNTKTHSGGATGCKRWEEEF